MECMVEPRLPSDWWGGGEEERRVFNILPGNFFVSSAVSAASRAVTEEMESLKHGFEDFFGCLRRAKAALVCSHDESTAPAEMGVWSVG